MNLIDFSIEGHHKIYQEKLLQLNATNLILIKEDLSLRNNRFKYLKKIAKVIDCKSINNVHFLTLDLLYKFPLLKKINKKRIVIGTLHKEPKSLIKKILLKNFSKKISQIIVHSEFIKEELLKIGILNVTLIEYPSFYDYQLINKEELKSKKNLENKIVISALGGTRFDKGLDILIESFKYLKTDLKTKIVLNIAGKEEDIKIEYIQKKSKEYNINLRENYGYLSDQDFIENVKLTDIMVLPYRKIFGGNSGPMTEAVVNKIPCVVPKDLNIGKLTEKYNLGFTFDCENAKNLAEKIEEIILTDKIFFETNYYKKLTVNQFIEKHRKLYEELGGI